MVGIDKASQSLKLARSKILSPRVEFVCADVTSIPFKSSVFNRVAILEVLEHLPSPRLCVREADRCLQNGGLLVISVPHRERIRYIQCIHCHKMTPLYGHLHSFNENDVQALLPKNYVFITKKYLLNKFVWRPIFARLPFRIWLVLNDLLGKLRRGYWMIFLFAKAPLTETGSEEVNESG